jgi:FAD/FMN-containing dehydrogenase
MTSEPRPSASTLPAVVNFGANVTFTPTAQYEPRSESDVLAILASHRGQRIHAGGRLHSWSEAPVADDVYINLRHLNQVSLTCDERGPIATIGAGCQVKQALATLDEHGLTLPAVGLISEQTLIGAAATGTHGSGRHCLSHYVDRVRIAHYDAITQEPVVTEVAAGDDLAAARCSLGLLGIIVAVVLRPRPQYRVEEFLSILPQLDSVLALEKTWPLQQFFYLPWVDQFLTQSRRETESARSWLAPLYRLYWFLVIDLGLHLVLTTIVQTFRSSAAAKFFFRRIALATLIRRWHVVDKSQAMLIMEHELFRHIEMEVFVRRSHLPAALELTKAAIRLFDDERNLTEADRALLTTAGWDNSAGQTRPRYTHHYPVCIRRVLPDQTLLSMSSGGDEDFYALSFISYALPAEREGFYAFCQLLGPALVRQFAARCHWGKYAPVTAEQVAATYLELPRFVAVCQKFDPTASFTNRWLREVLRLNTAD